MPLPEDSKHSPKIEALIKRAVELDGWYAIRGATSSEYMTAAHAINMMDTHTYFCEEWGDCEELEILEIAAYLAAAHDYEIYRNIEKRLQ